MDRALISGTIYGVVLNDLAQIETVEPEFRKEPYGAPPLAPVVYIKPRTCLTHGGARIMLPAATPEVEAAATIALLFGDVPGVPVAAALALDICVPHASFYRPAIRERCRDGFLPIGGFGEYALDALIDQDIVTAVDGVEVHRWSLRRLVRPIPDLIGELAAFMSLLPGDVLLVGLPGDAPRVAARQSLFVSHDALPPLATACVADMRA